MLLTEAEINATARDVEAGIFRERLMLWPFLQMGGTAPNDVQTLEQTVVSCGGPWVRVMAMRGLLAGAVSDFTNDIELAFLRLRLQVNGHDLITDGLGGNDASFTTLFGGVPRDPTTQPDNDDDPDAPWLFFLAPPRLRAGDKLIATVTDTSRHELKRHTPQLIARIIDDRYWRYMYTLDRQYDDEQLDAEEAALAAVEEDDGDDGEACT